MPDPPTLEEIAWWADGIVYATLPTGEDVYFDVKAQAWRKVRRFGHGANAHWPQD